VDVAGRKVGVILSGGNADLELVLGLFQRLAEGAGAAT
jgi:hypothetical protein